MRMLYEDLSYKLKNDNASKSTSLHIQYGVLIKWMFACGHSNYLEPWKPGDLLLFVVKEEGNSIVK